MLCQTAVRSVRVYDILELSLASSISIIVILGVIMIFMYLGVTVKMMFVVFVEFNPNWLG